MEQVKLTADIARQIVNVVGWPNFSLETQIYNALVPNVCLGLSSFCFTEKTFNAIHKPEEISKILKDAGYRVSQMDISKDHWIIRVDW